MSKHRITYINTYDARPTTRTFYGAKAEAKARNEWGAVVNSRFTRYAIWVELEGERGWNEVITHVHGEINHRVR
jgi:hypothetical protein